MSTLWEKRKRLQCFSVPFIVMTYSGKNIRLIFINITIVLEGVNKSAIQNLNLSYLLAHR